MLQNVTQMWPSTEILVKIRDKALQWWAYSTELFFSCQLLDCEMEEQWLYSPLSLKHISAACIQDPVLSVTTQTTRPKARVET